MNKSMKICTHEQCIPEIGCYNGLPDAQISKCENYAAKALPQEEENKNSPVHSIAWYGSTLGMSDLKFVGARNKPRLVSIFGTQNTGKTTFLAALYLLISGGQKLKDINFAGSYSLNGWENIARYLRFNPGHLTPHFPPHTPRHGGRLPGLLHLACRVENNLYDYLITDPPGEWFESWAINQDDSTAEGARWMAKYASAFALFADCEALAGENRGREVQNLCLLARRIGSVIGNRPIAVIWSKSDISIKDEIQSRLLREFGQCFSTYEQFRVAAGSHYTDKFERGYGVLDATNWLLSVQAPTLRIELESPNSRDAFLSYRG